MTHPPSAPRVSRLVVLPWRTSLAIAGRNLRARLGRNGVTVLSLVLAVAFLSFTLATIDAARGLLATGGETAARTLSRAGFDVDQAAGTVGSGAKDRWIAVLSLLVCAVGIVNAQLMAVTERFREIGIMKCLGALDSMVLRLFLLEAAMQGLAGAVLGALAGAAFGLGLAALRFGTAALAGMSMADVLGTLGLSLLAGLGLTLLGVLYPAHVAARMQPVVAMRADL